MDASAFSPERRRLLEELLRKKGIQRKAPDAIPPRVGDEPVRLSHLQEGLWFLDQLDPGQATYNIPCATRMRGRLDVAALEQTLNEILRRHEALRTRFPEKDGLPVQVVEPSARLELAVENLESLAAEEREAEALRLATEEAMSPFDLENGPVVRAKLLRLGPLEHVLVINFHHIVSDGWSMGVFTRELVALYEAFSKGEPSPLSEPPIQFPDFAAWQREWLKGENLERLLGFWRERLKDLELLELPLDLARPERPSGRGAHHTFAVSTDLSDRLRALARQAEVTPFVALLSAFDVLLHSYSGQDDVVVGSPVACRTRSELEGLIGYFVNVLPFRVDLTGNPSFRELMERVDGTVEAVHANQDLPFGKLVEELQPPRRGGNPVYQVEFTLLSPEHAPAVYGYGFRSAVDEVMQLGDLTLSPLTVESGVSKFDLVVLLWDAPVGIQGTFEYDADLFEPTTIRRMAERFQDLLAAVCEQPDERVGALAEAARKKEEARRSAEATEKRSTSLQRLKLARRRRLRRA